MEENFENGLYDDNKGVALFVCALLLDCTEPTNQKRIHVVKAFRYLLSKKIINKTNYKKCYTNGYATVGETDFFKKYHQLPKHAQCELIRIMKEYVEELTIDEINDALNNENDCQSFKLLVRQLSKEGRTQINTFFCKSGILMRINDILLYEMKIYSIEVLTDVQIISKLIEKPEEELQQLCDKLDYYCSIIDKKEANNHKKEIEELLDNIIRQKQFQDFMFTTIGKKEPNYIDVNYEENPQEIETVNKKLLVTIQDNTYSEKIGELLQFVIDKGYYSEYLYNLFVNGLPEEEKVIYFETNKIAHVLFFKRIKQYASNSNIEEIFQKAFVKVKGKGKDNSISLKLGGTEGNKDSRAEQLEKKLNECLPFTGN
ncbi:MAG: hypothetical protein J6Y24_01975 [Bacteroidales bacterium]|nr:hypothetical protein [Bacteroidales bacterium]